MKYEQLDCPDEAECRNEIVANEPDYMEATQILQCLADRQVDWLIENPAEGSRYIQVEH